MRKLGANQKLKSRIFCVLESTAWNPESNTVLDYLTWGEIAGGAIQPLFEQTDLRVTGFYEYFDVNIYLHNRKLA